KANAKACMERGEPIRLIATTDERKRNAEQNRFLWGVVYRDIAEQAWVDGKQYGKDIWHEYFSRMFGVCDEVVLPDGEIIARRKSTTQMTVGEFAEFLTKIQAYAANQLGVSFDL
ncbi:MAG: recombination protein NinB, partial [Pseudomonadota bacterium]|nr:recombination protein NinB [Pseudomonadota bacterium]